MVALYSRNRREDRHLRGWRLVGAALALAVCGAWGTAFWQNKMAIEGLVGDLALTAQQDAESPGAYAGWQRLDRLRASAADYYSQHRQTGVPWSLRLGLYQGWVIEPKVREHYFAELERVMLTPTADNLTRSLSLLPTIKVYQRNTQDKHPVTGVDSVEPRALPQDNRAASIAKFGKSTLETYQMLAKSWQGKADPLLLKQTIPDYWYPSIARHIRANAGTAQPEAADYLYAGRQIGFYSEQINEPDVPRIMDNTFLVSSSRNYINSLLAQSLRAIETITLESDTLFAFGRADLQSLKEGGRLQLGQIAAKLLNTPNVGTIVIAGHADQIGDADSNLRVSRQRAETIKTYLVGKGVPQELVTAVGEGSRRPLVRCDTALPRNDLISCLEPNRRVEIEVRAQP
ncbi:OmpA family protein [Pseudomonas poae]|uniref:OmpA family protein n=2 Tax=Pseudomonas poae TaxID=200451 RepID=A0AAP2WJQ3_9PSED|nr:OmpA family protein [Pseudomonas poae]